MKIQLIEEMQHVCLHNLRLESLSQQLSDLIPHMTTLDGRMLRCPVSAELRVPPLWKNGQVLKHKPHGRRGRQNKRLDEVEGNSGEDNDIIAKMQLIATDQVSPLQNCASSLIPFSVASVKQPGEERNGGS